MPSTWAEASQVIKEILNPIFLRLLECNEVIVCQESIKIKQIHSSAYVAPHQQWGKVTEGHVFGKNPVSMMAGRGRHLPRDSPVSPPTRMPLSQMFLKPWGGGCPNVPRILHLCTRKYNRTCYTAHSSGGRAGHCQLTQPTCSPALRVCEDLRSFSALKTTPTPASRDPRKTRDRMAGVRHHFPKAEMETQNPPRLIQH